MFRHCAIAASALALLSSTSADPQSLLDTQGLGGSKCNKQMADKAPSDILDLKGWGIALPLNEDCKPTGKRYQLSDVDGYQNEYFYVNEDHNSVMFTVPAEGHAAASANGSPRTELKSPDPPSGSDKFLPTDSALHCLSQTMIVHQVCPDEQQLTISQMHGDLSDLIKVQWQKKSIRLEMPDPDKTKQILQSEIELGQKFSTEICVQNNKGYFYVNGDLKYTYPKFDLDKVVSPGGKGYMVMHVGTYSPGKGGDDDKGVMELFKLSHGTKHAGQEWSNVTIV